MASVRETSSEQTRAVTAIRLQETLIPAGEGFPSSYRDQAHSARGVEVTPEHCWSQSVPGLAASHRHEDSRTLIGILANAYH